MVDEKRIYDAAVCGGGIVGLAAALALAAAGRRVALIERRLPARSRGRLGFDARSVALTPASVDFLRGVGGIDEDELAAIEAMHVWECDGAAALRFRAPSAPAPLAWVVENSALVMRLWRCAAARIALFAPADLTSLRVEPGHVVLALQRGTASESIEARLVVAADGANSRVRSCFAAAVRREPMPSAGAQCAIATVARLHEPHRNTAWQRFGATGPVAMLPFADAHTAAVIWSGAQALIEGLMALADDAFRRALEAEVEQVGGGVVAVDRRFAFPLRQSLARDFNPAPRCVLVGDAARTLHPLAGQGVNIGLEDVRAIAAGARGAGDLGQPGLWRGYARVRRQRSKLMLVLMRSLLSAYCGVNAAKPWRRLARNTGVRLIDSSAVLKAQLVREAMGLGPLASTS